MAFKQATRAGMLTYYVDETGFTGEDFLAEDQPIFVQATNDFSEAEAHDLIASCLAACGAPSLNTAGWHAGAATMTRSSRAFER